MTTEHNASNGKGNAAVYSKKHPQYWAKKIFHLQQGNWVSPHFSVRFSSHGKQRMVTLKSTSRKDAATEARDLWREVEKSGWEAAAHLKGRKSQVTQAPSEGQSQSTLTLKELCGYAKSVLVNVSNESFTAYVGALRTIISEAFELSALKKGGFKAWRSTLDTFDISRLTRNHVQKWIASRIEKNPKSSSPKRTIRSTSRNAKSLFSKAVLKEVIRTRGIVLQSPFDEIEMPKKSSVRHVSKFDLEHLFNRARATLERGTPSEFEAWKILLLCVATGLRRAEVDRLRWCDIDLGRNSLTVGDENGMKAKTDSSVGTVSFDEEVSEIIRSWTRGKPDDFVIPTFPSWRTPHCRAGLFFFVLTKWLRSYEIAGHRPLAKVQKPIHELRKEAGSRVNKLCGLHGARTFLRHADINTTSTHYLDSTATYTSGIGKLIKPEPKSAQANEHPEDHDLPIACAVEDPHQESIFVSTLMRSMASLQNGSKNAD